MIKNFELNSIDAERFSRIGERHSNIRIDHNSSVTKIVELNPEEAEVDFRFTASYGGLGNIRIEGRLLFQGDAKDLFEKWSKTGNMPESAAGEIHTTVIQNCIPEAVMLARDLRLPPPIPIPKVNVQKTDKKKKAFGPEVA